MGHAHKLNLQIPLSDMGLDAVFQAIDDLHSAASTGQLHKVTALNNRELLGWLNELVYTAQETIAEIEKSSTHPEPVLRLVK